MLAVGLVAVAASAAAGCGFEPQFKPRPEQPNGATAATDLSYVAISPISERSGQLVLNELIELFGVAQSVDEQVFRLDIRLLESREGLAIEQDDTITRYNLRLAASFRLVDRRNDAEVLQGSTRAIAAYNVAEHGAQQTVGPLAHQPGIGAIDEHGADRRIRPVEKTLDVPGGELHGVGPRRP